MTYTIRPATQDERDRFVRSTWRRSFAVGKRKEVADLGGNEYVNLRGGQRIQLDHWLAMHRAHIDAQLARDVSVWVAVLDDECLGWAAWDAGQVHYVYVAPRFRRKGIGSTLLRHAFDRSLMMPPTHLTYEGELLLSAVLRQQARSHTSQPAAAEVHDG